MKISVRNLQESEYSSWENLVSTSPQGSIYSLPQYLEVLSSVGGGSFRIVGAFKNDELVGGVGLYERKGLSGTVVSNRLLLYYNGIVLKNHPSRYPSESTSFELEILSALEASLSATPYSRVILHNRPTLTDYRPFLSNHWMVKPSYTYVVSCTNTAELWNKIEKNLRRLIRRAEEGGLSCSEDDDFESFFQLHTETHLRKHAPLYLSKENFSHYFQRLSAMGLCKLYHARLSSGASVASQLVLTSAHPITHTVCAASDLNHLKSGATPFLRWSVFCKLSADGYQENDLTDAALNSVTHFKAQLGGSLQMTYTLTRKDSPKYLLYEKSRKLLRHVMHKITMRS